MLLYSFLDGEMHTLFQGYCGKCDLIDHLPTARFHRAFLTKCFIEPAVKRCLSTSLGRFTWRPCAGETEREGERKGNIMALLKGKQKYVQQCQSRL